MKSWSSNPTFYPILLLLAIIGLFSIECLAQKPDLKFLNLSTKNGLSNSQVKSITQDSKGYIWLGTQDGLNRFDGYQVKIYSHEPQDSTSLRDNEIWSVFEDQDQNLWILTGKGLDRYDQKKDIFVHYDYLIHRICEDKDHLWMATGNVLLPYHKKTKKFGREIKVHVFGDPANDLKCDSKGNVWYTTPSGIYLLDQKRDTLLPQLQLPFSNVQSIIEDKENNLWFSSLRDGVYRLKPNLKDYDHFEHKEGNPNSLGGNSIQFAAEDNSGRIWFGTLNDGLSIFDKKSGEFYNYKKEEGNSESLSFNTINTIYHDSNGQTWLGTYSGGADFVLRRNFSYFYHNIANQHSLNSNNITSFYEGDDGILYIGTDGGGLNVYDRKTGTFSHYKNNAANPKSIGGDIITSIQIDKKGYVWIGFWAKGLDRFDPVKKEFTHYLQPPTDAENSMGTNCVMNLYQDSQENLWVCTLVKPLLMDTKKGSFTQMDQEGGGLRNYIGAMLDEGSENFWFGTWEGLGLWDRKERKVVKRFTNNANDSTSLSHNKIYTLHKDKKGRLWIGTANGLNLFDGKDTFKKFRKNDGFPSDAIYGILEDKSGNLWLSTGNGICRFNPDKNTIKVYYQTDGLQGNEFKQHAYYQLKSGEMVFGGENGFNLFDPNKMQENTVVPKIALADFKIFNKSVPIREENSPLSSHIDAIEKVSLTYNQNVFSIDYTSLNYISSEKNQYAYKMEGFDKDWNYVGNQRSATYTNLDPGTYTFRVKGSNNDGVWNEEGRKIGIIIAPPFWKTWWFKIALACSILGGALVFYRARINLVKAQKKELEKQVDERTAEVVQQKEELMAQADILQLINKEMQEKQDEIEAQRDNLQVVNEQIMSSIQYANTIQKALLPSLPKLQDILPDISVLYRPKDVVSGDFYWFSHLKSEETKSNKAFTFLAVVDCTGHGVAGAFMSIIGSSILNEVINRNYTFDPAKILEDLDLGVKQAIENSGGINTAGMDVCLCRIEKENAGKIRILYAGAKRPLFYIQKDKKEVQKLEGDRRSIGSTVKAKFTTKELFLNQGDMIYLFSDGYVDQNNPDREKFGTPRLRVNLLEICNLPMDKQIEHLEKALDQHQQNAEQRDDISLLGVKF